MKSLPPMSSTTTQTPTHHQQPLRLLSLDGGGVRGLITALWLHRLQAELPGPLNQHVDLIAGTSTGSLLACGMASGHTAQDLVEFYQKHGEAVFPRGASRFAGRLRKLLSGSRYNHDGLRQVLDDVVGDTLLGQARTRVIVTCFAPELDQDIVFDSASPDCADISMRDACLASASLPGIFPAYIMNVPGHGRLGLVDGGVVSTDPAPQAVARLLEKGLPDRLLLASFGTGIGPNPPERIKAMQPPGDVHDCGWMAPLAARYLGRPLSHTEKNTLYGSPYHRFQTQLPAELAVPDHAGREQVKGMILAAQHFLDEEGGEQWLIALANELRTTAPEKAGAGRRKT